MIKDAFCFSCDYLSDFVYAYDHDGETVHVCLDCKQRLENNDGAE